MRTRVVATSRYEREAQRLLTAEERSRMEESIASDPAAHPVVAGTGGVRKARWSRRGKGKRGGVRVIYYCFISEHVVYMLSVYSKSERSDMSPADRRAAKRFVEALKNAKKEGSK